MTNTVHWPSVYRNCFTERMSDLLINMNKDCDISIYS